MRRALIGFSAPIGYAYRWSAPRTANDMSSSPNPVLFGSMGLFTLYDELWFACESLCPESMRDLDYVKFVDQEHLGISPGAQGLGEFAKAARFEGAATINDLFEGGYADMPDFVGSKDAAVDNHTHGLRFLDMEIGGNLTGRELAADIWLVEHLRHLDFDIVLNPVTAKLAFSGAAGPGWPLKKERYEALRIADAIVSLTNLYDITGLAGPYHPCVEEIRNDDLIKNFRRWITDKGGRFNNTPLERIQQEVDDRLYEFKLEVLDKHVERDRLKNVLVDVLKEQVGERLGIPVPLIEYLGRRATAQDRLWCAFVAKAHLRQDPPRRGARGGPKTRKIK